MDKATWRRVENSGIISKSPVRVGAILITPNGSNNADVTLYDGESTSDVRVCKFQVYKDNTRLFTFYPYLLTERGLYVVLGTNVTDCLVQFCREGQG